MEDHYDPPEGFVFDPQSRQYYRDDGYGTDPASGADVLRLTWFDPQSGEYRQTAYPAGQVDSVTHMDEQPAQRRAVSSASLKPFVPKPLTNRSVHPDVHGTGYVGVLAFAAWLAAVIGPIAALVRF